MFQENAPPDNSLEKMLGFVVKWALAIILLIIVGAIIFRMIF